jgi:hypothetical protein
MKLEEVNLPCQISNLQSVAEDVIGGKPCSIGRRGKLFIRRRLDPSKERTFKYFTNRWINRIYRLIGRETKPTACISPNPVGRLAAGDWVSIRALDEIESTLNHWKQVRGCSFMPPMADYCGTIQRIYKVMERFVDERDLTLKKSSGILLLEGVICRGTIDFGDCDRACFHFWREEWLEKIAETPRPEPSSALNRKGLGRLVKVRSLDQIEKSLDQKRQLKGCSFLPEMTRYCGTVQRILKQLAIFVDERDLKVKRASGIFLLEDIMCSGLSDSVRCDRSCHLLWREEWLQILDE